MIFYSGTRAFVKYNGAFSNMHSVWDSFLIESRISREFGGDKLKYGLYLVNKLKNEWASDAEKWKACESSLITCPNEWATVSNQLNCDMVWVGFKRRRELGEEYYKGSINTVDMIVAKAGLRIAHVLDQWALNSTELPLLTIQ
jgi:hypothetical protein